MNESVLQWLARSDKGLSSESILAYMEHDTTLLARLGFHLHHPHDPSDLGRCIRLLDIEPSYRRRIMEMASISPQWEALATHWGELEALYRAEVPDHWGPAPSTYARMKELIGYK